MAKKKPAPVVMNDGSWYLDKFDKHECCDCGLVHDVEYTVENGKLFTKWKRNEKETRASRKQHGLKVSKGSA